MWNLLEVLILVFWSSFFFLFFLAVFQPAMGKEAEDAQTVCIFMELFDFKQVVLRVLDFLLTILHLLIIQEL